MPIRPVAIPTRLRRLVAGWAKNRCEYCGIPESVTFAPLELDHIIAQKHGGSTTVENLALSCSMCNKYKGSDIASVDPDTGEIIALYHPRRDRWSNHFYLQGAKIHPLSPTGRVTVRLLKLNHPDRVAERELLLTSGLYFTLE